MEPLFRCLVAAVHTPFAPDGALAPDAVEAQAARLLADGVEAAFVAGTTGEAHSLTVEERMKLAARWLEAARGSRLRVVVHVGANCLADARALAAHAERHGAVAIAALAPSYFKPTSVEALVACCAEIASAAPATPFYFYDIPTFTGVSLPMPAFLEAGAARIPTLAGLKFTNSDLASFIECVAAGRHEMLWGFDEMLLPALAAGAEGAVGSTYNFAAPLYRRLMEAFARGDLPAARQAQARSIRLVRLLVKRGFMPSCKALMEHRGVPLGPPRLPILPLGGEERRALLADLDAEGFLET